MDMPETTNRYEGIERKSLEESLQWSSPEAVVGNRLTDLLKLVCLLGFYPCVVVALLILEFDNPLNWWHVAYGIGIVYACAVVFVLILTVIGARSGPKSAKPLRKAKTVVSHPEYLLNRPQRVVILFCSALLIAALLFPPCRDWPMFVGMWPANEIKEYYWSSARPFVYVVLVVAVVGIVSFIERRKP